jgi:BCD family chlorophyll transporter-like MFS transporter
MSALLGSSKKIQTERKFITIDGNEAVARVAYRTNEVIAIYPGMTPEGQTGMYMGAWGIADALSRALGNFLSGFGRDAVTYWLGQPLIGYVSVFFAQALLLGISLWLLQRISETGIDEKKKFNLTESIALAAETD